jgi:hypothetical protein
VEERSFAELERLIDGDLGQPGQELWRKKLQEADESGATRETVVRKSLEADRVVLQFESYRFFL